MMPLIDSVAYHARCRPGALACVDLESGRRWSYAALDEDVDRLAAWLTLQVGPASGARVATLAHNSGPLLVLHLACMRAGAIFTPFNWRLAMPEIAVLMQDAGPAMTVRDAEFGMPSGAGLVFDLPDLEREAAAAPAHPPEGSRRPPHEAATLLYTSGTSGRPKGVIITESNVFWGCMNFIQGNDATLRSVFLCDMPMFHTAGLFAAVRAPLLAGGTVLISRGFDAARTLARLADPSLGVTHYFSVPQMALSLWQQPGFSPAMLARLTVYATGGAPHPAAQVMRFVRAGIKMSDGFGMSETCSNFGMPVHDAERLLAKAGSCGLPYFSVQARIVDPAGKNVGHGVPGELWLRGPSISPGYWNQPQLTADAFVDGWFKTGDTAVRDVDGFYFLIDRRKDMFISGGENVYPAEVEAVLHELEEVAEAAVIGVPDARWGEVGRAYIVVVAGRSLDTETIRRHCQARLARYKMPASVMFTETIPRTATGKVQKHLLQIRAREELSRSTP